MRRHRLKTLIVLVFWVNVVIILSNSITKAIFRQNSPATLLQDQSASNEELDIDFVEYDRIWRRVYYEVGDMSDFLDYFLESVKSAKHSQQQKTIDFIKSEFRTRIK